MKARKMRARTELFFAAVLFGLMAVLARMGSQGSGGFSPPQLTFIRFVVGTGMTVALFRLRPGTFRPVNHRLLLTRGLAGGLAVLLYFVALSRIPAGEATLLNNTFPVIAVLLSFFTLGERPTVHILVALVVVTCGMFMVLGEGQKTVGLGWGQVAGLASAFLGAAAVTSIRALRATDNAPTIFFAFCIGGAVVSAPFALQSWPADSGLWALAAAVGVLSFGAQILMTDAYGALTVAEAALWQQLTPVASYVWALVVLGERVGPLEAAGVLLGIAGVTYGTVLGHKAPGAAKASARTATQPVEPVEPS
ncbi:MAG TPA: DMT family transporter [Anaeromyxobacteraceae bacterium]|nr:DMT family transporter [Anaeromyxobacteraceae bacterium]